MTVLQRDVVVASRAPTTVHQLIVDRWSPRAFDESAIPRADLDLLFEAASLAPSAFNKQPWRFLWSQRDDEHWGSFLDLLNPFNQTWAHKSSALIFILSDKRSEGQYPDSLSHSHSFDAGAAWALFALQATALGYHTHAMSGLHFDRARVELGIPDHFRLEAAVAVGRRANADTLPEPLRTREGRSTRKNVGNIAFAGPLPVFEVGA